MYAVVLINIPDAGTRHFDTLEEATEWMRGASFESVCYLGTVIVASWSPITGLRVRI